MLGVLLACVLSLSVQSAPIVNCSWGLIQGVDKRTAAGHHYYGYYGIPYAEPPVGDLRFAKPVRHPGVKGVFNATRYGAKCLQQSVFSKVFNSTGMSEDCLSLNVFVPTGSVSRLPVLIWIHGGGFQVGDATLYEPWLLVTKGNVIVVTIQYRLGIFGFMSSGKDILPGNYGLWDQHMAISWVKDNVDGFGGDAKNITIIGESAGAASVAFQVLYPGSKGLFQRAVLQSGAATSLWAFNRHGAGLSGWIAYMMGCVNGSDKATLQCMRRKSGVDILILSTYPEPMTYALMTYNWVPVIDGIFLTDDPQILLRNQHLLQNSTLYDIDLMIGVNNNEGGLMLANALLYDKAFQLNYTRNMVKQKTYDQSELAAAVGRSLGRHDPKIDDLLRVLYTYPRPPPEMPLPMEQVLDTFADPGFVMPALQFAEAHERRHDRKCYFYFFNHFPSFTGSNPIHGMNHGEDLLYLFGLSPKSVQAFGNTGNISQAEYKLSDTFVKLIAQFAKIGDPNPVVQPHLGQRWPEYELPERKYLTFSTNMSVQNNLFEKRATLWLRTIPFLMKLWKVPETSTTTTTTTPSTSAHTCPSGTSSVPSVTLSLVSLYVLLAMSGIKLSTKS